jgi:hypothetical protein
MHADARLGQRLSVFRRLTGWRDALRPRAAPASSQTAGSRSEAARRSSPRQSEPRHVQIPIPSRYGSGPRLVRVLVVHTQLRAGRLRPFRVRCAACDGGSAGGDEGSSGFSIETHVRADGRPMARACYAYHNDALPGSCPARDRALTRCATSGSVMLGGTHARATFTTERGEWIVDFER